jgi:hypothetical protein
MTNDERAKLPDHDDWHIRSGKFKIRLLPGEGLSEEEIAEWVAGGELSAEIYRKD